MTTLFRFAFDEKYIIVAEDDTGYVVDQFLSVAYFPVVKKYRSFGILVLQRQRMQNVGIIAIHSLEFERLFSLADQFTQLVRPKRGTITKRIDCLKQIGFSLSIRTNEEYLPIIDRYLLTDKISELIGPKLRELHQALGCIGMMM
jgi:hypothetical protein